MLSNGGDDIIHRISSAVFSTISASDVNLEQLASYTRPRGDPYIAPIGFYLLLDLPNFLSS